MDWLRDAVNDHGWDATTFPDAPGPGAVYVLSRGPEVLEVEFNSGGIPHRVVRTGVDGVKTVIGSNYFSTADIVRWLGERP